MCNCGNKREQWSAQGATQWSRSPQPVFEKRMWADVAFQYTGATALSVRGSITGKHYRFSKTGDILHIDYKDASGMMGIPMLKRV